MANVIVRSANPSDLARVAEIHQDAFPATLTTRLGRRFVKAYYGEHADQDGARLLVATCGGTVEGFAIVVSPSAEEKASKRLRWLMLVSAVPRITAWPVLVRRTIETVRKARQRSRTGRGSSSTRANSLGPVVHSKLMNIAVAGSRQGQGVGTALLSSPLLTTPGSEGAHIEAIVDPRNGPSRALFRTMGWNELDNVRFIHFVERADDSSDRD